MAGTSSKPARRRTTLSAERIAQEAMALVDEEGLDGFSFRKLAKRLQCEAMSLYHYYPSKAHLFDALVDICVDETPVPDDPALSPRERLRTFALRYRDTALRHPGFTRFWITHRLNHRKALDWLNRAAAVFTDTGLPPETAARVFRTFSYFLTGAVLDEASGYARGPAAAEPVPPEEAARDFPGILALGRFFGPEHHLTTFETGLDVLLDWFDAELDTAERRRRRA